MSESARPRRRLPRPSTVLASIAVFAALAGTATAANSLINGKEIKRGTITGKQIKNKSLALSKLAPAAVAKLQGATGPRGPEGPRGAKGETGSQGPAGLQGPAGIVAPAFGGLEAGTNIADGDEELLLTVPVAAAGTYVISAKVNLFAVQATTKVECRLASGVTDLDGVQWTAGAANSRQPVSLQAVGAAAPGSPLRLFCAFDEGNGSAFESKLVAIPVS
jgi:hypothetical protein